MTLASEMNRIAHDTDYTRDEANYLELIEKIKGSASRGEFYIYIEIYELSDRNQKKLLDEGFKVEWVSLMDHWGRKHNCYKISWEDEEES